MKFTGVIGDFVAYELDGKVIADAVKAALMK
jgi:hypothetical protein